MARSLDEQFDYAGPDRNLGLLWLVGQLGASASAIAAKRAIICIARFVGRRLSGESVKPARSLFEWGDKEGAKQEFHSLTEFLPQARKTLFGDKWESSWVDWEKRWKKLQNTFSEAGKKLESPRQKK